MRKAELVAAVGGWVLLLLGGSQARLAVGRESGPRVADSLARLVRSVVLERFTRHCELGLLHEGRPDDAARSLRLLAGLFPVKQATSGGRAGRACVHYVLFVESLAGLGRLLAGPQEPRGKLLVATRQSAWEVKDFLKSPEARAYPQLLVVAPSTSRRTRVSGAYLLYTHQLYVEGSGSAEPLLLTSWINGSLARRTAELFPDKLRAGFMGHRLLVSVVENPPFAMNKAPPADWDGLEVRMLRLAASQLNFSVEFAEPRSPAASPIESAKSDVLLGLSSAAIGGIYQTLDSSELFDATTAHAEDCAAFISLASTALPKYRAILGPFQLTVWLLLCLSYLILVLPLCFDSKYTLLSLLGRPRALEHMFWFVFSTYTNSFVVKSPLLGGGLAKNSISILLGIYWVFTIIVTACYTGSIVSFITLPAYPLAKESASDLLAYRYRIGTLDHNGWERWFNVNTTEDPFLKRLFRRIEYVPSVLEGVHNASRAYFWPYAFLASKTSLDFITQTDFAPTWTTKRTLMHISKECFVRYNVVQLYPSKSLYTKPMNDFVIRATEAGLINRIVDDIDWQVQRIAMKLNKQITKRMSQKMQVEERTLTVEDTQGMFMLLGIGFLLAFTVLSLETLTNFLKKRHSGQTNELDHLNSTIPAIITAPSNTHFHKVKQVLVRRSV